MLILVIGTSCEKDATIITFDFDDTSRLENIVEFLLGGIDVVMDGSKLLEAKPTIVIEVVSNLPSDKMLKMCDRLYTMKRECFERKNYSEEEWNLLIISSLKSTLSVNNLNIV